MLKGFLSMFFRESDGIDELEVRHIVEAIVLTFIILGIILILP